MQSVPITTNALSSSPTHGEVYYIQHYVIKFICDLRQVSGFLRFSSPIKLTCTIQLKYCWKWRLIPHPSTMVVMLMCLVSEVTDKPYHIMLYHVLVTMSGIPTLAKTGTKWTYCIDRRKYILSLIGFARMDLWEQCHIEDEAWDVRWDEKSIPRKT